LAEASRALGGRGGLGGRFFFGHSLLESGHETVFEVCGHGLGFAAFVDFEGAFGGVEHDPAGGAFLDVAVEFLPGGRVEALVEVIAEFAKEVFTGRQRRSLPSF